ncbi:hypothetical protein IWQ60_005018 [Tieghemiomyces parasiticus]|uniref:Uncharacterized protein n=1 Tax=Tieghemiomyces parasiticus TaxID=78921 RepID=A0A9W8DYL8_9FUNG|nr:hypothetical protein IWQ60_005018 [Tieghemiomyces parasiticus]
MVIHFAGIVVATLAAQGKVDETLAYLKDLEEFVKLKKTNMPASDSTYDWVDSLRALPFIASAQCGQEAAMHEFGPRMATQYILMTKHAGFYGWDRAKKALEDFKNYSGPPPNDVIYVDNDIPEEYHPSNDPLPWYLRQKDTVLSGMVYIVNPMISCTNDGELSFVTLKSPDMA